MATVDDPQVGELGNIRMNISQIIMDESQVFLIGQNSSHIFRISDTQKDCGVQKLCKIC